VAKKKKMGWEPEELGQNNPPQAARKHEQGDKVETTGRLKGKKPSKAETSRLVEWKNGAGKRVGKKERPNGWPKDKGERLIATNFGLRD